MEIVPPVSNMPDYNQNSQLKPPPMPRVKSKEENPVGGEVGAAVECPDKLHQVEPRVSMSCIHVLCVFKTDYWPRQMAIEKLYEKHPCDRKDGPEKDMKYLRRCSGLTVRLIPHQMITVL